jgi:NAD(P)-dependent dehydrogenase (short-subunit alcohol dehydrogenase family)
LSGSDEVVIVTGGTHGIGRACVSHLAADGCTVVFMGRDVTAGLQITQELTTAEFVRGDVANDEDCAKLVAHALQRGNGRIKGLVNNAGISRRSDFASASLEDWDTLMAVNARAPFILIKLALPGLINARGAVVNVASIAGHVGEEGLAIYCAAKAALIGLTQAVALELGDRVRFNAICPGQIDTRMMARVSARPALRAALEARIPAGRFGNPTEVAAVIAWLLSPSASYVNGAVLAVDGGETAGLRMPQPGSEDVTRGQ